MKKTQTDGNIHYVRGLEDSILSKSVHSPRQSTNSVQSQSNYQCHFFMELEQKNLKICMETQKTLNSQNNLKKEKQSWKNQAP